MFLSSQWVILLWQGGVEGEKLVFTYRVVSKMQVNAATVYS